MCVLCVYVMVLRWGGLLVVSEVRGDVVISMILDVVFGFVVCRCWIFFVVEVVILVYVVWLFVFV